MSTSDYWTVSRSAAVRNGYSCRGCRGYIAKGAQVREWGWCAPPDWKGREMRKRGWRRGEVNIDRSEEGIYRDTEASWERFSRLFVD